MRSYRTYLRSVGRKSIGGLKLRTEKRPGDVEIIRDPKTGEWIKHVHEGEAA